MERVVGLGIALFDRPIQPQWTVQILGIKPAADDEHRRLHADGAVRIDSVVAGSEEQDGFVSLFYSLLIAGITLLPFHIIADDKAHAVLIAMGITASSCSDVAADRRCGERAALRADRPPDVLI